MFRNIQGHSMIPVLPPGTMVVGYCWFRKLKIGDVVILKHQGKEKIKRIKELNEQELYVVGDLEEESTDSRHFGWLKKDCVLARVIRPNTDSSSEEALENDKF
jgi:hypothetical protein